MFDLNVSGEEKKDFDVNFLKNINYYIVSTGIENCFKNKAVIAEDEYEVNGTNTQPLCYGPRKARINLQKQVLN